MPKGDGLFPLLWSWEGPAWRRDSRKQFLSSFCVNLSVLLITSWWSFLLSGRWSCLQGGLAALTLTRFWITLKFPEKEADRGVSTGFSLQFLLHIHWQPELERIQFAYPFHKWRDCAPEWCTVGQERSQAKPRSLTHRQLPLRCFLVKEGLR